MPPFRYYTVTQEREIKIAAGSAIDAGIIASACFDLYDDDEVLNVKSGYTPGHALSTVRNRDLLIREDY